MREIKFRAWDKITEQMINGDFVEIHGNGMALIYDEINGEWSNKGNYENIIGSKNFILMQYTGLNDKQGKEIYEGDIVTYDTDCGQEIVYKDCTFTFKNTGMPLGRFRNNAMVVIGNIFENPELLGVK